MINHSMHFLPILTNDLYRNFTTLVQKINYKHCHYHNYYNYNYQIQLSNTEFAYIYIYIYIYIYPLLSIIKTDQRMTTIGPNVPSVPVHFIPDTL